MTNLTNKELVKLHDSNIVAGITIHSFKAARNTRRLLLSRLTKGERAIKAMEKLVEVVKKSPYRYLDKNNIIKDWEAGNGKEREG